MDRRSSPGDSATCWVKSQPRKISLTPYLKMLTMYRMGNTLQTDMPHAVVTTALQETRENVSAVQNCGNSPVLHNAVHPLLHGVHYTVLHSAVYPMHTPTHPAEFRHQSTAMHPNHCTQRGSKMICPVYGNWHGCLHLHLPLHCSPPQPPHVTAASALVLNVCQAI